jgi:hypothetical protein
VLICPPYLDFTSEEVRSSYLPGHGVMEDLVTSVFPTVPKLIMNCPNSNMSSNQQRSGDLVSTAQTLHDLLKTGWSTLDMHLASIQIVIRQVH